MIYCKKCGARLQDDEKICPFCGFDNDPSSKNTSFISPLELKEKWPLYQIILSAAIPFYGLILGYLNRKNLARDDKIIILLGIASIAFYLLIVIIVVFVLLMIKG